VILDSELPQGAGTTATRPERNDEREIVAELAQQHMRLSPLRRRGEDVDDALAIAIQHAQKRLHFHISDDHASDWAPLLGGMVVAVAILQAADEAE
jgi:hypothetical protein